MNDKIKEYAEKANEYAWEINPAEDSYGRPVDKNKFNADRDARFAHLLLTDTFTIIKEAMIGGEEETQIGEIINDRLEDAASDVVDAFGIVDRVY